MNIGVAIDKEQEPETTRETIELFIESVRRNPCLWQLEHRLYRSLDVKEGIWTKIAEKHGFPDGREAKNNWKKLRDIHRDSIKRRRFKHIQPWKFTKQMAFLIPHMMYRKPENDLNLPLEQQEGSVDLPKEEIEDSVENHLEATMDFDDPYSVPDKVMVGKNINFDEVMDPIRKFFSSMCDSTKLLPEVYQLQIKRKIFEAVTQAEEHYLQTQMGTSSDFDSSEALELKHERKS